MQFPMKPAVDGILAQGENSAVEFISVQVRCVSSFGTTSDLVESRNQQRLPTLGSAKC